VLWLNAGYIDEDIFVIAAHGHAAQLLDSLTSVFSSYRGDMECILVLDGGIDTDLSADLNTIMGR